MTVILYLIGNPGAGKYTIAKELAKHGYIVCDNQLINNPIFHLLDVDGISPIPEFAWDAIEGIRDSVFEFLKAETHNNYVLTNVLYETDYDKKTFNQVQQMASDRDSVFVPVKLLISEEENIKRIGDHNRRLRYKSINIKDVYPEHPLIHIEHPNLLELDVSKLSAKEAADRILQHVGLCGPDNQHMETPLIIRNAMPSDVQAMVTLSYQKRREYEKAQPQFWRYAKGAEEVQTKWFGELLTQDDHISLVAVSADKVMGFVIGRLVKAPEVYDPGGLTLVIDDFCVELPAEWKQVGSKLLIEIKKLAEARGASQTLVVCGKHDALKRHLLKGLGLTVASEWYVGGVR